MGVIEKSAKKTVMAMIHFRHLAKKRKGLIELGFFKKRLIISYEIYKN